MGKLKLIGKIKDIKKNTVEKEIPGKQYSYRVRLKIKNTIHPELSVPKGIGRKIYTVERRWTYPFIPEKGDIICVDGEEIGSELDRVDLKNRLISISVLPDWGGIIDFMQYRRNESINSGFIYDRDTKLATAGISEGLQEKVKTESWKFDIKNRTSKSVKLESQKKGWIVSKEISIRENVLYQDYIIKRRGRKKEVDLNFHQILSFIPYKKNYSIHIPTYEKNFLLNVQPVIPFWESKKHYYNIKNGIIVRSKDTDILWSADMRNIEEIVVREHESLFKVIIYWNKCKLEKGESKGFKSIIAMGENYRIERKGVCLENNGECIWIKNGKLMN